MTRAPGSRYALVTGATGFVGSALVRHLLTGGWRVRALAGSRTPTREIEQRLGKENVHVYDGTRVSIDKALAAGNCDVVFHVASLVLGEHRAPDVGPLIAANIVLGAEVADAMVAAGVHRLVVAGSYWQHFGAEGNEPVNLYAATKDALRVILRYYTLATPLRLRVLTLFDTYGPDDPRGKILTQLREAVTSGEALSLSPGEQLLRFVHVRDVARAFVATEATFDTDSAAELEFAAASDAGVSLRDLVTICGRILGAEVPVTWGGRPYRPREVMRPWTGTPPPGWLPRISLAEGLSEILV